MTFIPIFPELVDNSMRKELVKCQKAAHYKYELGLRSNKETRVDLVAGKAFAKGMEAMRKAYYFDGVNSYDAIQIGIKALYAEYGNFACPPDSNKSADRMAGAMTYYVEKHPLADEDIEPLRLNNGKLGLEVPFSFPTEVLHPVTGKLIMYGGRLDKLGVSRKDGRVWFMDEKTTKSLGDKWANQWQMDSQMTGYYPGVRQILDANGYHTLEIGGGYINGVAIKKYDYDHARVAVYREPWEIDRWWQQYNHDLRRWVAAFNHGDHDYALDHACAYYLNPCEFQVLCKSRNPERVMDGNFHVERWNPLEEPESKEKGS